MNKNIVKRIIVTAASCFASAVLLCSCDDSSTKSTVKVSEEGKEMINMLTGEWYSEDGTAYISLDFSKPKDLVYIDGFYEGEARAGLKTVGIENGEAKYDETSVVNFFEAEFNDINEEPFMTGQLNKDSGVFTVRTRDGDYLYFYKDTTDES